MDVLILLFLTILFFKYIMKVTYLIMRFCISMLLLWSLKFYFQLPFSIGIFFVFCLRYMISDLSKKSRKSIEIYRKYRIETDCLRLRKTVRALFECNYIMLTINSYLALIQIIFNYPLIYSFVFFIKIYFSLLLVGLIKRFADFCSTKYYNYF